jgi:AraC-like DNA-binding protein
MAQLARFTTEDIAPRDRLARWDASLWGAVAPFRTSAGQDSFDGTAHFGLLGSLHLFHVAASAHRLERPVDVMQRSRNELIQLIVQRRGSATLSQAGRQLVLTPGMWTICDADRPFAMTSAEQGEQLIVLLPRDRLAMGSGLTAHIVRGFGDASGTSRLLAGYLNSLFDEIDAVDESNCGELADMAAQLVRLALFEARHAAPPISMRETLCLRVKDYVRRNVRDPALSIERVASSFGCTKRHLHKVFTGEEMTLSQFIWTERLERCREALSAQRLARHSITEIAFMWGFNNSAHFSKTFKERFGLPPGLFRERAAHMGEQSAASTGGTPGQCHTRTGPSLLAVAC